MKKFNFLSNLWSLLVGSRKDDGSTRYRLVIDSLSTRYRVWQYSLGKIAAVVCMLLTIGIGNVWGGTATITEDFEKQTAGATYNSTQTYTAANSNAGIAWFVEHGTVSTSSYLDGSKSMHMRAYYAKNSASGTWNGNLPYVNSTTDVKGLISITFNAAVSNTGLKMDVMYSTNSGSSWSYMYKTSASSGTNASAITFSNTSKASYTYYIPSAALSPTGNFRIKIAVNSGSTHTNKPGSAGNYTFRVDNIAFTYTAYTVTYNGNGNTSGSVPTDATKYLSGATVTVKSNSGSLAKTGYTFGGWNTQADGNGTNYTAGSGTFTITADKTLYAKWESSGGGSTPEITTSVSTLSNIGYSTDDFSRVVGSFTVSGSNLTNNVTVTPNSHHEICLTENGTYQTTAIELSKGSGTLAATTIYVRMRSGKAAGSYGGNIACASSGATTKNVNTTGNVPFTIQWYANGTLYHTSYAPYATGTGSNLGDLPDPNPNPITYSCDDKVFMGWYDGASYSHATDAPAYVTSTTKILSDKTFRAVFATEETGGEPTAYTAGDEGDFVLASYNTSDSKWYAIPTSPTVSSGKITGVEISVSTSAGSVDYVTGANATGYTWTIADATYGQTISDGSKYIYHSNGGSSGTNLTYGTGTTYTWTIESETNGLTFKGTEGSTVRTRGLLASGTTFGGYSLSNEDASGYYRIQVLPIGGMTYSDFNTTCTSCSNSVTVSYSDPGSGNTMTVQKGSSSVSSDDAVKTCSAVTLTVTLTATTHFTVGGLSATGVTGVTTTNVENVYTVTIPADKTGTLTLTPTFTEDAYRTIVFKSNGSALFNDGGSATTFDGTNKWKQKVYLTEKPVWPTDLAAGKACDGTSTTFMGWVADGQTWSGKKDDVPAGSTLITDASGFAAAASGSGDVVYHAVWAEASGSGTPHYAKVTSTGDITNGDYLIVYETGSVAFNGSLTTIDATSNKIDVTISESKITANSTVNAAKFTIDVTNKYIKSASDKYINQAGWSNSIAGNDAATSVHSMSIDGSGNFVVEGTGNDGAGTPTYVQLKYNAENSQKRFRFYKSGQEDIQLYKYDAGATYSNYLTTCCENYAVKLTGSGVVGGGTFSASSMQPCVGSTVELSATLCSGYTQGAWTVAKTGTPATTVTVTNNQFTMPSYAVTVSLATTAKVDHFIDRMHGTDGYTGDGAERSGCNYTVPNLSNTSEPVGSNCDETHYIFVGWVDADHVGSNGALLSGYSIISGNSTQNATGTTYYAIWAQAL